MSKNNRRQFLKNSTLSALALSAVPNLLISKPEMKPEDDLQEDCHPTTLDFYGEGPFYTENPPEIIDNLLASESEPGTRLTITGRVYNIDCSEFIPNTLIDVWHADDAGDYDNVGYKLRGKTLTNSQGFYSFETIYPGKYLNGGSFRPAHIHFKISPPGFPVITTQLYFEGDPDNSSDAASSITSGNFDASHRIIPLTTIGDGSKEGVWDIAVNGSGVSGINDIHIDKGMIYNASPNPFDDQVAIQYGVYKEAMVSLFVFDMNGNTIATLEQRKLSPEKYTTIWNPESSLDNGQYFIVLSINNLQVHYLKVVKNK